MGRSNCLALKSAPDIAHAAHLFISFVQNPWKRDWNAAKVWLNCIRAIMSHQEWAGNIDD